MYRVSYDGFTYRTKDPVFAETIPKGESEPYPRDLAVVQRYLRVYPNRCRTYIDVGAHIGTTLAPYSRLFKTCVGFEANPETFKTLAENVADNGLACQLESVALSDHEGRGTIRLHGSNSGCYYVQDDPAGELVCRTLDSYGFNDVDFLKLDVEGAELSVLKGAETTLRRFGPFLQLECNGMSNRLYGVSREDIVQFLDGLGYRLFAEEGANLFFYVPRMEPYRIFCYWGSAPMSDTRLASLEILCETTGCVVVCLTPETFPLVTVPAYPIHPAFPYLSDVHQSDYVRTYMMHHYGGGYSDVKRTTGSWRPAFEALLASDAWINGYPEADAGCIAYRPVAHAWDSLVGNGAYLCQPWTPLTTDWFTSLHALLDEKLSALKASPARTPRDCAEEGTGYPLEWNEMLGRIFHRVCFTHRDRILRTLPTLEFTGYL